MKDLLEPYNPEWGKSFAALKQVLLEALHGLEVEVEVQHVGSTSIPGMMAKPILDVDIIIHDKSLLEAITQLLQQLGYRYRGDQGIEGRFAFRQSAENTPLTSVKKRWQAHHLYVCYADSLALKNHLLFRDALLSDPELARRYALLKMLLASGTGIAREEYTRQKTDFVLAVLAGAGLSREEQAAIAAANK